MEFTSDLEQKSDRVIEIKSPKTSRPLWQKILFFAVLIGLLAFASFVITNLIANKQANKNESTTKEVASKDATASAKKTASSNRCQPRQDLDNPNQGYQSCFAETWKQKELKVSGLEIGLAASDITENFPGTINIKITDKSPELFIEETNNASSKFEFGKAKVGKKNATQTIISRHRTDPLIAYPQSIVTAIAANSRTYVITLNSAAAEYETNKVVYEQFLTDWEFLDQADSPPWSESRNIIVNEPWPGSNIQSPITVSGEAISFEGVVNVRIKDGNGKTLTETTLKTSSETQRSPFSGSINFDKPKTNNGTIEVFTTSANDGADQDKVSIKIRF